MLIRNHLNMFVYLRSSCSFAWVIKTKTIYCIQSEIRSHQILIIQFCFLILKHSSDDQQMIFIHWKFVKHNWVILRNRFDKNSFCKRCHKTVLLVILISSIGIINCEVSYYQLYLCIIRRNYLLLVYYARLNCGVWILAFLDHVLLNLLAYFLKFQIRFVFFL